MTADERARLRRDAEERIRARFPGRVVALWWVGREIADIAVDGFMAGRDDLAALAAAGFPVAVPCVGSDVVQAALQPGATSQALADVGVTGWPAAGVRLVLVDGGGPLLAVGGAR